MIDLELLNFVKRLVYTSGLCRLNGFHHLNIFSSDCKLVKWHIFLQHYTELPDIKRVIVNTHAIEPQVIMLYGLHWFFFLSERTCILTILFFSGSGWVLWDCFTWMGSWVHEGPASDQHQRQPSNNCPGTHFGFYIFNRSMLLELIACLAELLKRFEVCGQKGKKSFWEAVILFLGRSYKILVSCVDSSLLMQHLGRILQKYTTFGESSRTRWHF